MSMHLVGPYMTTTKYNRKQKPSKNKRLAAKQAEHEEWLAKMGVGKTKAQHSNEIPDYSTGPRMTSDRIAGNGTAKERMQYTGDEIAGIVTTHKSNLMPVRKDNKKAFVDAAQMRRN